MEQSTKQIKLGAIISYLTLAINIMATLIYMPWMVSVIGESNYAMYTLANSFVNIFVIDFGLSSAVSKFVAQYRAEENQEKETQFISTVTKVYLVLDIAIFVVLFVLFFFVGTIYKGLTVEEIRTFKGLYLIVASYAVVSFPFMPLSGIMYAYEKLIETKLCEALQKVFSIVMVVIVLLYKADVVYVVLANVVSALITIVAKYYIVKKSTPVQVKLAWANMSMFKEVVAFTAWLAVQSLAQRCIFNLAPTILGIVATSKDIAAFAPATSIEGYFATVAAAINGFFIMRITKYVIKDEKKQLYLLMLKVGRYQVILLSWIYVVFVCAGKNFMCAWMGPEFVLAWPCAMFVMLPDIMIFSMQVANTAAIAGNLVKQQALGYVIMAIVCVSFSVPLSSILGAPGAAMAIAIAYFTLFIYNNMLYSKKMKLDMWKFIKECYGTLICPIFIVGVTGYLICDRLVQIDGWKGFVTEAIIVSVLYFVVMMCTITKEERELVLGVFRKKV